MKIDIKPLSVNEAWQGKRYKTPKYNAYITHVLMLLPNSCGMQFDSKKLSLNLVFGFSSKNADIDNPVKCFVDCLQKKYGFNDRQIYGLNVKKVDVKKGCEFIEWEVCEIKTALN